jgi:multicomponent K+:H+ antiporter subunit A
VSLLLLVALPFVASVVAGLLPTHARTTAAIWAALACLASLVQVLLLFDDVRAGIVVRETIPWMSAAGVDLVVRVDGFAWMFALLVSGLGLLVAIYARYYMSPADPVPRFFAFFLAFMGAMLGVVVSGNLVQLAFFWELTSLLSFLLIGYWHHRADARRGARMALVVTGSGGLCLLGGVLVIGSIVGSYDLDVVLASGDLIRTHALYPLALGLVLIGALTKSAQFPFHFWLPHAMAAPTPVSAYLHSATMVKAGVFLLARLWPVMSGTELWTWTVGSAGLITLVLGAYAAMFHRDLKGLLAYSTVSHLGLITLLLGLGSPLAAVAAVFHIINHATFKASLFMAAGAIDHETGTRNIDRLSGLYRAMPITGTLALVASAAMAGVPLLNGFLSKEMFFTEVVHMAAGPGIRYILPILATLAGMFAVVYALRFSVDILTGPPSPDLPRKPEEPVRWMRVPIELLVLACLVVGIFPEASIGRVLATAAAPVVGGTLPAYSLALWHGFTAPLAMSVIATVGGVVIYLMLRRSFRRGELLDPPMMVLIDGYRVFHVVLALQSRASRALLRVVSTARLQPQLFVITAVSVAIAAWTLWDEGIAWGNRPRVPATAEFAALWAIGMVCAVGAAWQAKFHRLASITMLAGAGLVTCLTFAWFSAPDLALTQLVVETVTTVLFLLGLRWLPRRVPADDDPRTMLRARVRRARDLVLACLAGGGLATLSYALLTRPAPQSISPFFLERSLPQGGGANVINVTLVDFRSFDTLGEISVLGIVALTVYALLRRFRPPREALPPPTQQRIVPAEIMSDLDGSRTQRDPTLGYLLVPAVLARLLLPVAGLVAAYLFLRGHNEPGGGFVAGLVVAIAFIMQYLVAGAAWVEAHLRLHPARWIAVGLLFAVVTGAGAIVLGYPFLTTHTAHVTLPIVGEVHVPSALLFDLGVFATVTGATLLILIALAHQSIRSRRKPATAGVPRGADRMFDDHDVPQWKSSSR